MTPIHAHSDGTELRKYFLERKAEQEQALADAQRHGFRLMQVTPGGADIDVTEQHLQSLQHAIDEYQKAADVFG